MKQKTSEQGQKVSSNHPKSRRESISTTCCTGYQKRLFQGIRERTSCVELQRQRAWRKQLHEYLWKWKGGSEKAPIRVRNVNARSRTREQRSISDTLHSRRIDLTGISQRRIFQKFSTSSGMVLDQEEVSGSCYTSWSVLSPEHHRSKALHLDQSPPFVLLLPSRVFSFPSLILWEHIESQLFLDYP